MIIGVGCEGDCLRRLSVLYFLAFCDEHSRDALHEYSATGNGNIEVWFLLDGQRLFGSTGSSTYQVLAVIVVLGCGHGSSELRRMTTTHELSERGLAKLRQRGHIACRRLGVPTWRYLVLLLLF